MNRDLKGPYDRLLAEKFTMAGMTPIFHAAGWNVLRFLTRSIWANDLEAFDPKTR